MTTSESVGFCAHATDPELSPESWDGAEGAGMIAALRHSEVCCVLGCEPEPVPLWSEVNCG